MEGGGKDRGKEERKGERKESQTKGRNFKDKTQESG